MSFDENTKRKRGQLLSSTFFSGISQTPELLQRVKAHAISVSINFYPCSSFFNWEISKRTRIQANASFYMSLFKLSQPIGMLVFSETLL